MTIHTIAFDADDTLWHNENLYRMTEEKFLDLLSPYHDKEWVKERLFETEIRNLKHYGYGIKAFTLSMIETAVELTEGRIKGHEIQHILDFCRQMLAAPVKLLPGVEETVKRLAPNYKLMIITKGDLLDQETKITNSGIDHLFAHTAVVSEKTPAVYADLLTQYGIDPAGFLMLGNSVKSDVLPIVEIGGHAIHIPYHTTWAHEQVNIDAAQRDTYYELDDITQLPDFLAQWTADQ